MSSRTLPPKANAVPRKRGGLTSPAGGAWFALSALSAVLLAFCFPFASAWWLAWFALAPLYYALLSVRGNALAGVGCGAAFGFTLHLVGCKWMDALGTVPWVGVSVFESGAFAVFGAVAAFTLFRLPGIGRPVFFAALWTTLEYARTLGVMAFPWFPLAASQVPCLLMVQIVSVTGQWGLSFALALANGYVAEASLAYRLKREATEWAAMLVRSIITIAATFVIGAVADTFAPYDKQPVRVAIVQGNIGKVPENGDRTEYRYNALNTYLQMTQFAVKTKNADKPVDFVLWPETVVPGYLLEDLTLLTAVTTLARDTNTDLLVGTEDANDLREDFNAVVYLDKTGAVRHNYAKQRLVPMGEFFPFRESLSDIYAQYQVPNNDLSPGTASGVFDVGSDKTRRARVGMLICYEAVFPYISRDRVRGGAQVLVQATSDQTFDGSPNPQQHADLCVLRAVETRRWFVRAGATGLSEIINAEGRVLRKLPTDKAGTIVDTFRIRDGETFFVRFGDWFAYLSCLVSATGFVLAMARRKPARVASSEEAVPAE